MDKVKSEMVALIPFWVLQVCENNQYLAVYSALKSFTSADQQAFPSRARIAKRARVSVITVARALKFFQEVGAVVVEHQYHNNMQTVSLYTMLIDRPKKYENLRFKDQEDAVSPEIQRCISSDLPGISPQIHRTKSIELEPIKEKEKILKEKEPTPKAEVIEEFVAKVRAVYPKRSGNMGWKYFTQRAATHFKTAKSKDDFLLAVANYKKECAELGRGPDFIKQPASFIAAHYDYITSPQEQESVFDGVKFESGWGDTPSKQVKIAPWSEMKSQPSRKVLTMDDVDTTWK
jgi:DNA-binding transcriptional regulator YhcF (GntR family)